MRELEQGIIRQLGRGGANIWATKARPSSWRRGTEAGGDAPTPDHTGGYTLGRGHIPGQHTGKLLARCTL